MPSCRHDTRSAGQSADPPRLDNRLGSLAPEPTIADPALPYRSLECAPRAATAISGGPNSWTGFPQRAPPPRCEVAPTSTPGDAPTPRSLRSTPAGHEPATTSPTAPGSWPDALLRLLMLLLCCAGHFRRGLSRAPRLFIQPLLRCPPPPLGGTPLGAGTARNRTLRHRGAEGDPPSPAVAS